MLYLLYIRNGFIKKFPLNKSKISVGRLKSNDFYLDESFISKKHAVIKVNKSEITIEDSGSTNGIVINSEKVKKAVLKPGNNFRIGYLNFVLKQGNAREIVLSDKVKPKWDKITQAISLKPEKTRQSINILYSEQIMELLQIGFQADQYKQIFQKSIPIFEKTLKTGTLILISKKAGEQIREEGIWSSNSSDKIPEHISEYLQTNEIFLNNRNLYIENKNLNFFRHNVELHGKQGLLIYSQGTDKKISEEKAELLDLLAAEFSIISHIMEDNRSVTPRNKGGIKSPDIVTVNQKMINLLVQSKKIAASNLFALIHGESGTGKELLARYIHNHSPRREHEFVALNCAAIPETLMENELFGHEKGAFTDATTSRKGKLEVASGGTLVLDEIGDMPLNLQAKLLRAIQEGQFYRIGSNTPISVDLRIIGITNKDIKDMILKKEFREDLYYRIAHVVLKIPPLRERSDDIVNLINHFVKRLSKANDIFIKGFSKKAIEALEIYEWPGNVRELENEVNKILNLSESGDIVGTDLLKDEILEYFENSFSTDSDSNESEKSLLINLLNKHKWNKSLVAKELDISRTALYEKLKKHQL